MKRLIAFVFSLLVSFSIQAQTLTAVSEPWPPFVGPNLPAQGVVSNLISEIFKTQGYELEIKYLPWARATKTVRNGEVDILMGAWWTAERGEYLRFSDPFLHNVVKFIKRKGEHFEFDGFESLTGKTIGIIREYSYGDEFSRATNFKRSKTSDLLTNIKMLLAKRIDLTLSDELVAKSILSVGDADFMGRISFIDPPLSKEELFIASGVDNPNSPAIIDAFNAGLKQIISDGTYDEIIKRHGLN